MSNQFNTEFMHRVETYVAQIGGPIVSVVWLLFFVLKLVGLIDWSWWWVTSPIWVFAIAMLGVNTIAVIVYEVNEKKC